MAQFKDITGQKIGRWTVNNLGIKRRGQVYWNCTCECGTNKDVSSDSLNKRRTQSCGCLQKERVTGNMFAAKEKGESGFRALYGSYRQGAEKRGHRFELTEEEFRILTKQNCHYCGDEPNKTYRTNHSQSQERNLEHSKYHFNGIDRVVNTEGYITSNVVTCCKLCNKLKNTLNAEVMIEQAKKITYHQEKKLK